MDARTGKPALDRRQLDLLGIRSEGTVLITADTEGPLRGVCSTLIFDRLHKIADSFEMNGVSK